VDVEAEQAEVHLGKLLAWANRTRTLLLSKIVILPERVYVSFVE
jgi:hypothetical protein